MAGLRLKWFPDRQECDLVLTNGVLDLTHELETFVNACLFTDRRAEPGDRLPPGDTDPRGWWGDAYSPVRGDKIGSKLWLRVPGRSYETLPRVVENDIAEALQCLVDDGIVSSVDVSARFPAASRRRIDAVITLRRDGQRPIELKYDAIWQEALQAA